MKNICGKIILVILVLFSNLGTGLVAMALTGVQISVVDTLLNEDTFYSFENSGGSWDDEDYTLALRKPNLEVVKVKKVNLNEIDWLYPYRLDGDYLNLAGKYDLFLLKEEDKFSEIILRDGFEVKTPVSEVDEDSFDFTNWLRASVLGVGGDEILLAQATLNRFDIEDLPATVQVQQPITFTLKALNVAQEQNVNYTGTVKIEVLNDSNAVVPSDYTFVLQDAGEHKFVEGLVLNTTGTKTIRVEDTSDENIFAEFNIEVVSESQQSVGTILQVESPTSQTYTDNRILVKGQTEPGLEVTVLESGAEFRKFDAEVDGSFTELLPPLEDGLYVFQLKVNDTVSSPVNVEIRTGGVTLRNVTLSKETVAPVELVEVEVEMTDGVNSVSAIINGVKTELQKQDLVGTFFKGQITAPISAGSYPITLVVVDQLGGTQNLDSGKVVVVSGGSTNTNNDTQTTSTVPTKVTNISGESLDKKISLSWQSAQDDKGIVFYTIRYGTTPTNLDKMIDTTGNVTTWYIPNLVNSQSYYFQIFGVDTDGNEGVGSDIVTLAPGRPDSTSLLGSAEGKTTTSETGPELWLALILAFGISGFWRYKKELSKS